MRFLILFAFGLSGAAALIYEVTWMRALSLVFGSTTYALSTMLSTFMAGLALGGYIGGLIADKRKNLLAIFGLMELGIGIFGLVTIPMINYLSAKYLNIYNALYEEPSMYFTVQFLLCAGIMLIPTTLMGATFPVVSRRITDSIDEMGREVGRAYSINTFGAILGSFSAGFILIPLLGVKLSTIIAASLNVIVALGMIFLSKARIKGAVAAVLFIAFSAPLAAAIVSYEDNWTANYYNAFRFKNYNEFIAEMEGSELLFNRDYTEGRVRLWRDRTGFLILQSGGKFEGSIVDYANTHLLSYLPIASHRNPRSFLLIGLGIGDTLSAAKESVHDVSLVEINKGVVEALREFGPRGLLDGVGVKINDARNHLLLTKKKYDIITSGPSYPTESSSGNLFTREFYEIAVSHLNPGGIYCQSVPYYLLSNDDVTMLIKTFGSVFEHVYLWKVSSQTLDRILIGSNEPFSFSREEIIKRTRNLNRYDKPLPFEISRSPEQIKEIIRTRDDIPLNTDDKPYIEFHAARNVLTGARD
ncbi:MAG: fused MFS/spermidine synthase [Nitrospirota bacterium]